MDRVIKHLEKEKRGLKDSIKNWEERIRNHKREIDDWGRKIQEAKENISQIETSILKLGKHD